MTCGPRDAASASSAACTALMRLRISFSASTAPSPGGIASSVSAIMPDATSPASCPPAPSATAQTPRSGRSTKASSLCERVGPVSLADHE